LALVSAGALTFPPAATPASAQAAASVSLFYGELAPHGRWFQHARWGWAWFPATVGADWRPYSQGQWAWTEENGWYWISDEPFGWAVYHYGRWAYDAEYGWIWIPGSTWGPAWVAFRESDDYVGWAPLPPETLDADHGWQAGYTALDASYYQPRWVFVPRRHFLARRAYAHAAPAQRNVVIIRATRNVTHYERGRRGIFNRGFERRRLEAALGRRITPLRVNVVNHPRRAARDRTGRQINVFRPAVRVSRDAAPPPAVRVRPQDRPRVRIQRDAVAPADRRQRAAPPATPRGRPPAFRAPDTATPRTAPPPRFAAPPATPPRSVQPDRRREREERRAAPRSPNRAAPPAPRVATPPQPPRAPQFRREQRAAPAQPPRAMPRPATPRPPAATAPRRPPSFAAPPAPRSAPPGFARPSSPPPRVAPSAPPTPRAQPPARKAPPPAAKPSRPRRGEDRRAN
jgi:hypothetical protein